MNKYRNIVETSVEGIWIFNAVSETTYVNEKMAEMLRYNREEMIGKFIWNFAYEEDKCIFQVKLANGKQGIDEVYELKLLRKDGSPLWVSVSAKGFFDNAGNFAGSVGLFTDITEHKKAEEALRLSNIYNRSLIEASLDPLVTIGYDGKVKDVNKATEQATGCSRNDLIGTYFAQYLTKPDQAIRAFQRVCECGELRDRPLDIQHKDGHATPVLCNASVYRDEHGEIIGVFVAARDITVSKKTEEALKRSNDNLEELVEERTSQLNEAFKSLKESEMRLSEAQRIAHIGNWDNDLVIGELYWSDEMYRIFGRNPQGGITYDQFLSYVHPDDRDYVYNSTMEAFNGKIHETDYRIVLPDRVERIVNSEREVIFDEKNNPIRMRGTVQDITERKNVEEKIRNLANIVESSNGAIGTISPDGIITSWNKGAERVYGYSAEEVMGKPVSILSPPHLAEETKKFSEKIKNEENIQRYETSWLRKEENIIYVSVTLSPVFDSHGKMTAISFISRDITERKKVEEKLSESEEKYRNIVETANEGIIIIDDKGIITFANNKMKMFGYDLEEGFGRLLWDYINDENRVVVEKNMEKWLDGIIETYELELTCKDGSSIWTLINSKPLFDKSGKDIGVLAMITDIT